jgi:ATP-dependent DNA helicase PIF1
MPTIYEEIFSHILDGHNTAILSPGGTGKSYLLQKLGNHVGGLALTSSTGIGAVQIGGRTVHSWSGIGLGDLPLQDLINNVEKSKEAKIRWNTVKTLVIDEISMLGAQTFLKLEAIARYMKGNDSVFGGIQVVVSGDFLQLPPINDKYVFNTEVWDEFGFKYFILTKPRRFKDMNYADMLNRIRKGAATVSDIDVLRQKMNEYDPQALNTLEIKPTELFSTRRDVDRVNQEEFQKLPGSMRTYKRNIHVFFIDESRTLDVLSYYHVFDRDVPEQITLKVGAQVMLTANVDVENGYANGSRGVVRALNDKSVSVLFSNGLIEVEPWTWVYRDKDVARVEADILPLILAWSLTVHKTQGCSLDSATIDIGSTIFAPSQAYVALSRIRSFDGLHISSFIPASLRVNTEALKFMEKVESVGVVEIDVEMNQCNACWFEELGTAHICTNEIDFGKEYCRVHQRLETEQEVLGPTGNPLFERLTPDRARLLKERGGLFDVSERRRSVFIRPYWWNNVI